MSQESPPFALPGEPKNHHGRVFAEPWQAQVFAITLALHQRGVFTWPEWASTLGAQIAAARAAGDADLGDTYYHHWLAALEQLLARTGISSCKEIEVFRGAWKHAADRTPHGEPVELDASDFVTPIAPGAG